jgi:hypothetical protein
MQRPANWLIVVVITGLLAMLACVLILPRLLYPPLSGAELQNVPTAKERIELQQAQSALQNDVRTPLLQGFGGLLLVAGVIATWQQVLIGREGQITERFTRAIDQLGSKKLDVRLGGIFALERIAKNSKVDREPITRILEAFVRTHAPWPAGSRESPEPHPTPTVDEQLPWLRDRAADVQACMIVLGRRVGSRADKKAHLPLVDLRRSYLSRSRLARAELQFSNLARARMRAIHLEASTLIRTDLRHANLQDAFLTEANLNEAYLDQANLCGADLRQAVLAQASLRDADLREADLRKADLSEADLRGANLTGANLDGADLSGAREDETTIWPGSFDADRRGRAGVIVDEPTAPTASKVVSNN